MALTELERKIGKRICSILDSEEYRNLQKKDLADKLGIPNSNFSDKLTGKRRFHIDELYIIADALDVSVDYLLGRSETKSVEPDMQAAVKALGLSQKSVENIADSSDFLHNLHNDLDLHDTNSMNVFLESAYCKSFFNLWDEVAENAAKYYDHVRKDPSIDPDGYDRSSMILLAVFRLMKLVESAATEIYDPVKISCLAEADYFAAQKKEADDIDGKTNQI